MRLRLSPLVPGDLEEIAEYIAQDSPHQAARMIRLLRARMKEIAKQPLLYRLRPELASDARMATVGQYVILFRVRNGLVRIERVAHGSRDLLPVLGQVHTGELM
ncbi:MAG: type II toxin-antitoxin system RelE/ParE family toxin [Terracidiphilus sp.]